MKFDVISLARRFCRDDSGQDLIEYALLTGIVTVSSIVIFASIRTKMMNAYVSYESTGQANWNPNDPITP